MPNKTILLIKNHTAKFYRRLLRVYFKRLIGNKKICIISNDCWAGELYKLLDRPFNTPFIGLMLMSPCYIKLMNNPRYFLGLPLVFKNNSKYPAMQEINAGKDFPVGVLGDSGIEIHFLHYDSEDEANEKWKRRIQRIDWDNLFIKYDCGKDYADLESVEKFIELPYADKLIFGKENFGKKEVFVVNNYSIDALIQFRNCFLSFNPVGWLIRKPAIKNNFQKFICCNAYKYL
jgi:uncharacterized protein (DUF1919 family)